jgi:hypothetical protein
MHIYSKPPGTGFWLVVTAWFAFGVGLEILAAPPKPAPAPKAEPHTHADKGPNGGDLIELGDEEYHAELVMDEKTNLVTIYLLGSDAKKPVAIPAKDVSINLKHGGKPGQFKLKALALKTDPPGLSSRFSLKDDELVHDLNHKNNDARLSVKVNGKPYTAKIEVEHDHKH